MNVTFTNTATTSASGSWQQGGATFHFTIRVPPPDDGLAGVHAVLGIPPNSYRERLKETHPDHGGSEAAVREVIDAYRRLS